jgi:hypothetical protein
VTRDLKKKFDNCYLEYKQNRDQVSDVQPNNVRSLLRKQTSDYFSQLRQQINSLKDSVKSKIQESEKLQ